MKSPETLTRHQILLYEGDFDRLSDIYRRRRATEVIRLLVRRHIQQVEARYHERINAQPKLDTSELESEVLGEATS